MAADAPVRKVAPAPVAEILNWSGFYVGGHVGYGRSSFEGWDSAPGSRTLKPRPKGFLVGLHAGANYQTAPNWLWGWEVDVTATPGWSETLKTTPGAESIVSGHHSAMASLRLRLGWTFDRTLLYATGGIAAHSWNGAGNSDGVDFGTKRLTWAPVAGVGAEWKVRPNFSWRIEGLYYWNRNKLQNDGSSGYVKFKNTAVIRVGASWYY
jgi:outer membrane immunogenic protein